MSVNHEARTIIGFFPGEDFLDPIRNSADEDEWKFQGTVYNDMHLVLDEIGKAVGAEICVYGDAFTGDINGIAIQPDGIDDLKKGGRYTFADIIAQGDICMKIRARLREFGLEAGLCGVWSTIDTF